MQRFNWSSASVERSWPALVGGILLVVGLSQPGAASDVGLLTALREARCGSPVIKPTLARGDVTAFEVNCFGTSHRLLTVTCVRETCRVEQVPREEDGR